MRRGKRKTWRATFYVVHCIVHLFGVNPMPTATTRLDWHQQAKAFLNVSLFFSFMPILQWLGPLLFLSYNIFILFYFFTGSSVCWSMICLVSTNVMEWLVWTIPLYQVVLLLVLLGYVTYFQTVKTKSISIGMGFPFRKQGNKKKTQKNKKKSFVNWDFYGKTRTIA